MAKPMKTLELHYPMIQFLIIAYIGRLPPERGSFFRLQVYKRVGISQVEVYKRVVRNRSFRYLNLIIIIIIFRTDAPYGCISLFIKHYMKMRTRLPKVVM